MRHVCLVISFTHTHERTRVKVNKFPTTPAAAAEPQTYPFLISRSLKAGLGGSLKTQDVPTSGRMIIIYKSYLNSTPHLTARMRRLHILDDAVWRNRWEDSCFNSEISPVRLASISQKALSITIQISWFQKPISFPLVFNKQLLLQSLKRPQPRGTNGRVYPRVTREGFSRWII